MKLQTFLLVVLGLALSSGAAAQNRFIKHEVFAMDSFQTLRLDLFDAYEPIVWDGNTVVIGGLMSEKITDIQDKVPILGDIPLVGRLWQSKVKQTTKKCVLMFVTVKVIDPGGQRINLPAADLSTDSAMAR